MTGSLVLLLKNFVVSLHGCFKIGKVKFESKSMFENLILFNNELGYV